MSYHPYTRLNNTSGLSSNKRKSGPVRPLFEPRKPGVTQPQKAASSQPSSSSDTLNRQSTVRFVPNLELVASSSAPPIPPPSSPSSISPSLPLSSPPSLSSSQTPQSLLPQTPLPQTQTNSKTISEPTADQQSARGFSIRRPRSIVKDVPGEDISYQMYREEMRINTLVACLGVIISAAALVISVSKNKNVNDAVIVISIVVISLISVILIVQLSSYDWKHGIPGGVVFISILAILGTYFASDSRPA